MALEDYDGRKCPYCGRAIVLGDPERSPTRDHVLPRSRGGTAILIVCWRCNNDKGCTSPDRFLKKLSGCRRTIARLAMIDALQKVVANPERFVEPSPRDRREARAKHKATEPFSTTTMQDAFARAEKQ